MPISGDRPAHRGTLVAFWSWWWGYPLSFAFLFALCPQAQKVWGVQLCRWAPHVPMPTSYADLIWYWGRGWLSLHRVIWWFICSGTPNSKELRQGEPWFYTPWTVCVLAYDNRYTGYTGLRPKMMFQYCLMWRQSRWVGECNRPASNSAWRVFQDG